MDRVSKSILIVLVLPALLSCGVFFSPMEGRWNTADPKNELLTFNPSLDGYVEGTIWKEGSSLYAYPGKKIAVLRFDNADFPNVVAASYLQLTVQAPISADAELLIFRIISDWDTGTISYDVVNNNPGIFFEDSQVTQFTVPGSVTAGEQIQIPLGEVFSGEKDKLANGIIIYSSINVSFDSTELETPPLLLVEPE